MHKFIARMYQSKTARMIRDFDKNQEGLSVLENVLLLAAAALFLALIIAFGKDFITQVGKMIKDLFGFR